MTSGCLTVEFCLHLDASCLNFAGRISAPLFLVDSFLVFCKKVQIIIFFRNMSSDVISIVSKIDSLPLCSWLNSITVYTGFVLPFEAS